MKYMIIKKSEYEILKKTIESNDEYIKLIKINNQELASLTDSTMNLSSDIKITLEKLNLVEKARRTNAGKIGGLTTSLNKEKKKSEMLLETVSKLEDNVKDLEVKLEESMSDKYVVKKLPADKGPRKTQTMKIKNCTVQSNIARKMFGDSK